MFCSNSNLRLESFFDIKDNFGEIYNQGCFKQLQKVLLHEFSATVEVIHCSYFETLVKTESPLLHPSGP